MSDELDETPRRDSLEFSTSIVRTAMIDQIIELNWHDDLRNEHVLDWNSAQIWNTEPASLFYVRFGIRALKYRTGFYMGANWRSSRQPMTFAHHWQDYLDKVCSVIEHLDTAYCPMSLDPRAAKNLWHQPLRKTKQVLAKLACSNESLKP